ncbi:MAG: hypothetical protein LHW64_10255 [Candidatus Cloacimonetes bacterium]|nr:hypothetical protein [Candidatus Cloacimonadota bacterium]MDY0230492.1 hypothetical protein [Candidatus Cloacimonadaceae bacterium]
MLNLFKIDFVQGKTDALGYGQVQHSLEDAPRNRSVISLSVSGDKLQSVSNYSREPKRLVFECFPTAWIQDNILSGENEHERYVSHFEVRAYRDNVLFFTGIIDTSQLSFDISSGILKITCYDKIKLLSLYSDLTHYYSLSAGYLPIWILAYFLQDIEQVIPISIPYLSQFNLPNLNLPFGSMLTISHIDYSDMNEFPVATTFGWTYVFHGDSWPSPVSGYKFSPHANIVVFVFAHKKIIQGTNPGSQTQYLGRYRGRVISFYHGICPVIVEYDKESDWTADFSSLESQHQELINFFVSNGVAEATLFSLNNLGSTYNLHYTKSQFSNHWVKAHCYGNLFPAKLQPGKFYETFEEEQTDNIKALQAMLMLYNATIYTNASGQIILKNKDAYSPGEISIDDRDVISLKIKRGNQETPDMDTIEVLAGDTTQLQGIIKGHLLDFYDGKWSIDAEISQISKYDISLLDKIRIQGIVYAVVEVERDISSDEIKLKAWRL